MLSFPSWNPVQGIFNPVKFLAIFLNNFTKYLTASYTIV